MGFRNTTPIYNIRPNPRTRRGRGLLALGIRLSKEGLYIDIRRKAVKLLEVREDTI